jgi:alanine dehydrogenase
MAVGLGAAVTIIDRDLDRLRYLDDIFGSRVKTLASNPYTIAESVAESDLVVGGVLVPGAAAPKLVTREMLKDMNRGSVIVDVAVDQGACIATIRPTTLAEPTYVLGGVVHYGVTNMPALVPRTSTFALTNATLSYVMELAERGIAGAIRANAALAKGVNVCRGHVVHPAVAAFVGEAPSPLETCLR